MKTTKGSSSNGILDKDVFVTNLDDPIEIKEEHLQYLKKALDYFKGRDETNYLLIQEKLLYLGMDYLALGNKANDIDFNAEANLFLEIMNKKSVEYFNGNNLIEASKCISRLIDFLNQKNIPKLFNNQNNLDEARILTYNNLSCIYRKIGKLALAAKAVTLAITLEEKLVVENIGNSAISIISTYLNKSAILSEMKKHDKAIETVNKGMEYLKKAQKKTNLQENEINHLKQLEMLSHYNLGVEYEHLDDKEKAIANYQKAITFATEIGKQDIKAKIEKALSNLK